MIWRLPASMVTDRQLAAAEACEGRSVSRSEAAELITRLCGELSNEALEARATFECQNEEADRAELMAAELERRTAPCSDCNVDPCDCFPF